MLFCKKKNTYVCMYNILVLNSIYKLLFFSPLFFFVLTKTTEKCKIISSWLRTWMRTKKNWCQYGIMCLDAETKNKQLRLTVESKIRKRQCHFTDRRGHFMTRGHGRVMQLLSSNIPALSVLSQANKKNIRLTTNLSSLSFICRQKIMIFIIYNNTYT